MGYTPFNCKLGAFTGSQNFIPSALSAKTVAIMAHNKGLELGADMVLLLKGGGLRNNTVSFQSVSFQRFPTTDIDIQTGHQLVHPYRKPVISSKYIMLLKGGILREDTKEECWRGGQSTGFLSFSPVVSSQALFPWQPPARDRDTAVKGRVPALS